MPLDAIVTRPDRMSIASVETGQSIEMQYNPDELEETIGANYAKQIVPGLSHTIKQFIHTEDLSVTFDLSFDALTNPGDYDADDALNARRFLHSLCFPRRGAATVKDGAPSRALFMWPELYTLTTVILKVRTKFTRFARSGKPTAFKSTLTIEEIRDFRLTAEDVLADGTQRADSGGVIEV